MTTSPPPRVAGNTKSPERERLRTTSQAARESGRTLRPVFVSPSVAVRRARSISLQRSVSASPERQPLTARKRATAIAGGHMLAAAAFRSALPSAPHSAPHRIGENCTQQSYRPVGRTFASPHARQSAGLGLSIGCGLAFGHIVHEAFDILARNSGDPELAEQRLDVTRDAAFVDGQRACLLLGPAARQQPPCFGVGKVKIAQLGNRLCIARCCFFSSRIALVGHIS